MKDKLSTIEQIAVSLWIIAQSLLIILTDTNVLTLNSTITFSVLILSCWICPTLNCGIIEDEEGSWAWKVFNLIFSSHSFV